MARVWDLCSLKAPYWYPSGASGHSGDRLSTDRKRSKIDIAYQVTGALKVTLFGKEAEWRLISPPFYKNTDPRIKYREGQSMLIPYVEFELSNEVDGFDLPVVIVGPTPNNNLSISAVVNYLSSQKVVQPAVFASGIPYRSW